MAGQRVQELLRAAATSGTLGREKPFKASQRVDQDMGWGAGVAAKGSFHWLVTTAETKRCTSKYLFSFKIPLCCQARRRKTKHSKYGVVALLVMAAKWNRHDTSDYQELVATALGDY